MYDLSYYINALTFLSTYIILELGWTLLLYYIVSHVIWALYLKYQGESSWYLAFLPFKLQFMKMNICGEITKLPIFYIIACILCSRYIFLWWIPWIFNCLINKKFYSAMLEDVSIPATTLIPFKGKYHLIMEVYEHAGNGAE